jgi:nitric oxide reductase NorD protein
MGLADLLDPEESVGWLWHRWVGHLGSYPEHPEAAVELGELRTALGVVYRALGGAGGREIAAGTPAAIGHRLSWRARITQGEERIDRAVRSDARLLLPPRLSVFPERALNRRLYYWLVAWFAALPEDRRPAPADPLQADLRTLCRARATEARIAELAPGLAADHAALAEAAAAGRPARRLPRAEAAVEAVVQALLTGRPPENADAGPLYAAILRGDHATLDGLRAPRGYRPFLPVPLWGELQAPEPAAAEALRDDDAEPGAEQTPEDEQDDRRRRARREDNDQVHRNDPFALFVKPDFFLAWAEMLNLNRKIEDSDAEQARQVADDLDHLSLTPLDRKPASKLKLGLDLAPPEGDDGQLVAATAYPEWNWTRQAYDRAHAAVTEHVAPQEGERWQPDAEGRRHIRKVKRQFEALTGRREVLRGQLDGPEIDTDAVVRRRCDLAARGAADDRIYAKVQDHRRDLAVAILVDASMSTDGWVRNRRVMDVEKEALSALALGIDACGDRAAIYAFASKKRRDVRVDRLKAFDERVGPAALGRIAALRPGQYTRMGAALRHMTAQLAARPERHRLTLLITDSKPNDLDHYEGRHGIEDTRMAVREARSAGQRVFAVTVDRRAEDYVPYLFGRGGYTVINHIERLAPALPAIYRQLVS